MKALKDVHYSEITEILKTYAIWIDENLGVYANLKENRVRLVSYKEKGRHSEGVITLTLDEAKDLRTILNALFENED